MAQAISEAKVGGQKVAIRVGKQVIDILTTGMYSNPLMVLREYIQNSVDAIDAAVGARQMAHGAGTVIVTLDGAARSLQVADNGTGVPHDEVVSTLCSLGCSAKDAKRSRGFRELAVSAASVTLTIYSLKPGAMPQREWRPSNGTAAHCGKS
jgi:molecular chaperone HtpG